jgi:PAS domain S-box-containing protein
MEAQPEPASREIKRLQRCINDLVSLLALPAVWSGGDPFQVLHTLLDALMRMLSLDLVSVQLTNPVGETPVEIVRVAQLRAQMPSTHEICEALSQSFGDNSRKWPPQLRNLMGEGDVSIVALPLGLQGELGIIVAAAQRADFPQQTEALLLSVAASQASIGLQEARFRSQQQRIADELDQRVAQRTAELAAANVELQLQVGLLQRLPVSAWTLKPDGTPDFVNQVWLEYSGQTLDFVRSHPEAWMTAVDPEDRETASRSFWDGVHSGQGFAFETRSLRARDRTYRWHLNQAVPLRDAEGKVLKFVGTTTDIDDQKRAQEELRTSENKLKKIINTIPTAAWSARPDGYCDFINQPWLDYAGLSAEQGVGWGWGAAIHPDDLPGLVEYWQACLASGTPVDTEARMRRFDGVYRWFLFRANPLRNELGNIIKWYGTNTDIDDRKRAEEGLRASEITFRTIVDSIPGLVCALSPEGEIELLNRQLLEYYGKTVEEMKDWTTNDCVHPDDRSRTAAIFTTSIKSGNPFKFELRCRRADGVYRWFQVRMLPALDPEARVTRWYALMTDIEDRKQAEEALNKARSELAHVSRVTSLGALTASIAHEVNQPLSGIITNASTCLRMLATDPPQVEGARETARRTIRDGNRMSEVITRLRALFTKKEAATESVNLNDAVLEVIALSIVELQKNHVTLRPELADNLPLVTGDRVQLQQVILNLLRNGSDAMSTVEDRPRLLVIKTEGDEGDRVRLTVQDAGVGFDPQSVDRLFDAFYTTKGGGMGIGLSVSRSIIESHNGRLWATLNEGPGAAFSFSIPRASEGLARADSIPNIEPPAVRGAA